MKILPSARRHGVPDADIAFALAHRLRRVMTDDDVVIYIGPARDGQLLEIGVILDDAPRIIHAMPARKKYLRHL